MSDDLFGIDDSNDPFQKIMDDIAANSPDYQAVVNEPKPEPEPITVRVMLDSDVHIIAETQPTYAPAVDLIAKRDEFTELNDKMNEMKAAKKAIEDEIEILRREYGTKMGELRDKLSEVSTGEFDLRRALREAERKVQAAENILREALAGMIRRQKFIEESRKWDDITAGLKWREFAFGHQIEGAKLLAAAKRGILGDKMGLGKTLTSLIFCDMVQSKKILVIVPDDVVSNFVSEIQHWAPHRSIIQIGKQTRAARDLLLSTLAQVGGEYIIALNYSAWRKDKSLLNKIIALRLDTVIMDEAHNVKNVSTSAYKGCEKIVLAENSCPNCRGAIQHVHDSSDKVGEYRMDVDAWLPRDYYVCIGDNPALSNTISVEQNKYQGCGWTQVVDILAGNKREYGSLRSVKYVVPMTGTVILNKPTDIFPLLRLIDDKNYAEQWQFENTYCQKNAWTNKIEFKPGGLESLTKKLAGKYIARDRKSAGVVLPKQEITVHRIEMDKELYADQYRVMEQLSKHAMLALSTGKKMPILATIALITRKRQANVWPAGIEFRDPLTGMVVFSVGDEVQESIKLDKIIMEPHRTESREWEGLIPDFTGNGDRTNGERVVVFSQFKGPLRELERRISAAGIDVVRFDGDTPDYIRNELKRDFDRKVCDQPGYEYKWQVALCNYKTGGVGLNFTGATQMIILDEEWNAGKADQAYGRIDRMGQTEETNVHILRIEKTIDTWMADLIQSKRDMAEGFEQNAELANDLLKGMESGEML